MSGLHLGSVQAEAHSARHASITEGLDCSLCHTTAGWSTLSERGAKGFDHARTGFPLTGRHKLTPCTGCHHASEKITRQCSGCHKDAHEARLGSDCSECHSALDWNTVSAFDRHRRTRLPLTGMHALVPCVDCHRNTTQREWTALPADCYACHAQDYQRKDIHPSHTGGAGTPAARPFPRDCAQCHRADAWTPAIIDPSALRALVQPSVAGLTRAPLHHEALFPIQQGSHRHASCDDCHRSEQVAQLVQCTGCHAHNPVALQTQHAKLGASAAGGDCLSCHRAGARR
jgi:Zn finger protein HypA/HybF involved in hydrogenase expression